ncbi:MAG: flagellar assembly protein FliW [Geminicoccaceae bacterium]
MTLAPAEIDPDAAPLAPPVVSSSDRSILFPAGLPGFPDVRHFVLEPSGETRPLRLRGLDGSQPSFHVLPLGTASSLPDPRLDAAASGLGIAAADLAVLVVATRQEGTVLRANLRAPLLVDTRRRLGWQVVLPARPGFAAAA